MMPTLPPLEITEVRTSTIVRKQINVVKRLCTIEVDLKKLPEGAFVLYKGKAGNFYQTGFDLVLVFGSVVLLQLMYGHQVIVEQSVKYDSNN
jgi:hypothetical protein